MMKAPGQASNARAAECPTAPAPPISPVLVPLRSEESRRCRSIMVHSTCTDGYETVDVRADTGLNLVGTPSPQVRSHESHACTQCTHCMRCVQTYKGVESEKPLGIRLRNTSRGYWAPCPWGSGRASRAAKALGTFMRRRTTPPSDLHLAIAVYRLACYNESRQHSIRINHVFRPMRYSVTTSCNGRLGHKLAALVSTPSKQNTPTGQAAQTPARGCSGVRSQGYSRELSGCRVARDG